MIEIFVSTFLILGCLFTFVAALGLVRMPDFYCRMQSVTKGTTLGVGLVMLAVAIFFNSGAGASRAVAVVLFFFVTSPAAGHMLSRAAYLIRMPMKDTQDSMANHPAWKKYAPTRSPKED